MYQNYSQQNVNNNQYSPMAKPNGGGNNSQNFSHKAATVSTDLHCYFECEQTFKKDFELHLHLKLKHRKEDPSELRKAYQAAEEEIALVRRSASTFQCALCPKILHEDEPFRKHIIKNHNWKWEDYKEQYGRCEVESAPFECKICGRVVKYSRNTVHGHLTSVHNITWPQYLDRIRKMRKGERPEELPQIESFDCRICNVTVKFILKHLERVHKITEDEYFELYPDQTRMKSKWYKGMASKWTPDDEAEKRAMDDMRMNQNPEVKTEPFLNPPQMYQNSQMQRYNAPIQFPDQPLPPNMPFQENNYNPRPTFTPRNQNPVQPTRLFNYNNMQVPENPQNTPGLRVNPQTLPISNNNSISNNLNPAKSSLKPPKADIQNPKNKNCSSCNTSFNSRKGFIEHCTSFHNMKFKTASGATISAQTISQKTSQTHSQNVFKVEPSDTKPGRDLFNNSNFKKEDESFEGPFNSNISQNQYQSRAGMGMDSEGLPNLNVLSGFKSSFSTDNSISSSHEQTNLARRGEGETLPNQSFNRDDSNIQGSENDLSSQRPSNDYPDGNNERENQMEEDQGIDKNRLLDHKEIGSSFENSLGGKNPTNQDTNNTEKDFDDHDSSSEM